MARARTATEERGVRAEGGAGQTGGGRGPAGGGGDATEPLAADPDATDVSRAAEGDLRAFERLYRRHVDRISSLVGRMLSDREAEDVTQEVFIRAWEKLGTFRGDAAFSTWLYRVALSQILQHRRQMARRRERSEAARRARPWRPDRQHADPVGLRIDFDGAIRRLPDGAREVFVLYDVEGYSHAEIAEMLDVSTGTTKSQLHRARMLLREHMDR